MTLQIPRPVNPKRDNCAAGCKCRRVFFYRVQP